ncbi:putative membrane associated protein [Granulibacter bethesdensis]|uniref:Membrane associated protein n=2 Tax=Granulibacter bethesdensis TaxID=364410 RepID=A0AAN0VFN2_9PROT|nr:putative membrane associated protein [Granulibacter bethesdensis]
MDGITRPLSSEQTDLIAGSPFFSGSAAGDCHAAPCLIIATCRIIRPDDKVIFPMPFYPRTVTAFLASLLLAGCQPASDKTAFVTPAYTLDQLTADLAAEPSATKVLQRWCIGRGLMPPASHVTAQKQPAGKVPSQALDSLHPSAGYDIVVRHVHLMCGPHVVSIATLAYLPEKLTPDMNRQLLLTDQPFGKIVLPLHFERRRLADDSRIPHSTMGETPIEADSPPKQAILINRALLTTSDGQPFAYVEEQYQRVLLNRPIQASSRGAGDRTQN